MTSSSKMVDDTRRSRRRRDSKIFAINSGWIHFLFSTVLIISVFEGKTSNFGVGALEMHFEQKEGGFFLRSTTTTNGNAVSPPSSSSMEAEVFGNTNAKNVNGGTGNSDGDTMDGLETDSDSMITSEHFTVFPSPQPVSIRVTYGPFSTKQTVPIRLLVPDPIDNIGPSSNSSGPSGSPPSAYTSSSSGGGGGLESEMIPPLDLSAHLVTPTIPKDTPILRVLFHAGQTAFGLPIQPQAAPRGYRQQQSGTASASGSSSSSSRRQRTRLCLVAQVTKSQGDVVTASCSPDARDSTCLAELTLPIHWWPESPLITDDNANANVAPVKPVKIPVQVSYSVYEPENGHCNEIGLSTRYDFGVAGEGSGSKRIQIQPPTPLASAVLVDAQKSYRIVKADESDSVKLLVPQGPLYPHAKFYVPVIVGKHDHQSIVAFIMRARVKSGVRIIGIEPNIDKMWNITTDFNPRRTHATITAVRKFDPRFQELKSEGEEVFNWILEAAEEPNDDWDGGRVVWILRYVIQPSADSSWMKKDPFSNFDDERHRLTTRLEIQKDDIQAVIPIAKSWEVVNTAVLDGKQVSRPMKIFIVSRSGQVADVTLQTSCRSLDESVLKVSSSCTSVYVDGSEIRGSTNATIAIKYGTYEGQAEFIVWMPEFPLDIQLSDPKLNQIKGWRVPNGLRAGSPVASAATAAQTSDKDFEMQGDAGYDLPPIDTSDKLDWKRVDVDDLDSIQEGSESTIYVSGHSSSSMGPNDNELDAQRGASTLWTEHEENNGEDHEHVDDTDNEDFDTEDKFHCRLRYQHSRIDVFAKFLASDHDSGRTSYFISKRTYLKVTDLVSDFLRVADTHVAIIKANSLAIQGMGPGRTEVQVVSPVTGRVLGAQEVRVVNEKVSITSMKVQVISGVQLSLFPDSDSDNEFVAETIITSKLSAKYQEALLDIKLTFSDNSWIKLDEIDRGSYVLAVDSLEPRVVELPPIQNSKYPRILAVSEGGGPIMRVSLELSDQCHRQNSQPLAMSVAEVEVNFTSSPSRSEFTQNDSHQGTGLSKHSIRKPSRSKEQRLVGASNNIGGGMLGIIGGGGGNANGGDGRASKKDMSNLNVNDITGIPLKDDSSRASRPSAHMEAIPIGGFGQDKGWTFSPHSTPLEVAMYVLLGVFSVAILVFVASCVVYASRVKKRELSHIEGLSGLAMKFDPRTGGIGAGATNAQHDWIWLGRTSLGLHPSLDANQAAKHYTAQSSTSVSFDSNNSMNPIRIITNPNFDPSRGAAGMSVSGVSPNSRISNGESSGMMLQQQQNIPSGTGFLNMNSSHTPVLTPSPNPVMVVPPATAHPFARPEPPKLAPPRPPKPSSSSNNTKSPSPLPFDTTTFSVKSNATTPVSNNISHNSNKSNHRHKGRHRRQSKSPSNEYRPPVPPHRNLPSSSSSASAGSPMSPETSPPRSMSNTPPKKHSRRSPKLHQHQQPQITHRIRVTKADRSHRRGRVNCDQEQDPDELPNPTFIDFERRNVVVEKEKKQQQPATSQPTSQNISPNSSTGGGAIGGAPTVIGNPMCYIDEEDDDDDYEYDYESEKKRQVEPLTVAAAAGVAARQNHKVKIQNTDNVKLNMDYDQLMEYFDSLKETEA